MSHVDLGFAEKCTPWKVESYQFPSKMGGKPAWLDLENLPSPESLQCENCQKPMVFLCQVYAPYEEDPQNFHRTIFIFICRDPKCCVRNSNLNIRAFRNSLKRENEFYSSEPPVSSKNDGFSVGKFANLCDLCGCLGPKKCGKCQRVRYCSREHQVIDWKEGHRNECQNQILNDRVSRLLFSELEIVIESEEISGNRVTESEELEKFEKLKSEGKLGTMSGVSDSEIEKYVTCDTDKVFTRFKKIISGNDDQILRYERGGQPLWIANEPKPDTIPDCEFCKSPREFEFQVMPQILSVLHENELDIGVILLYTCAKSCTLGDSYKKEFIFKQDI